MKILILGAFGQVGKALYRHFSSQYKIDVTGTSRNVHPGLKQFDPFKDHWESLGKFDIVINSVGAIYPTHDYPFERIHAQLSGLIIKNRALIGNPKVIQISVLGAEESSDIQFLKTKAVADKLLLQEKNTYIVRPSIICTHRTMLVRKILSLAKMAKVLGLVIVPKDFPDHKIQPIMINDFCIAIESLCRIDHDQHTVLLAGPEEISFRSLIEMAMIDSGRKIKFIELSRNFTGFFVRYFLDIFFPRVLSYDQFRLLFTDNIADTKQTTILLKGTPASTKDFWKSEFKSIGK
jgi:uncharacterized protein YbjT (DUF2867 family)